MNPTPIPKTQKRQAKTRNPLPRARLGTLGPCDAMNRRPARASRLPRNPTLSTKVALHHFLVNKKRGRAFYVSGNPTN
ncbi:hypothetical protein DM02DRAFT_208700 [Periconia macrospinosa]|uniref:Uncharacterized protein n=1 Tax=Periconia macrospinosa TaxID=97972 RepID=A0A2V1E143_9PLEO|nr:hypothetical protein DM02DRAFT_208700 [Periconia macrospinosa]